VVIPDFVRPLLWEYQQVGTGEDPGWERLVIERVMALGGWAEMRWLWASFGPDRLGVFLRQRGHRVLSPREVAFWSLLCGIADEERREWVSAARARERAWRG
jgi:hypothetical protein